MKVAVITPMIAPYRTTFFEKLSQLPNIELIVYHGKKKTEDGRPAFDGDLSFCAQQFEIKKLGFNKHSLKYYPNLIFQLKKQLPDVIILEGAVGVFTNWVIIFWAKIYKKKIIIWFCGWEPSHSFLIKRIKNLFLNIFLNSADKLIVYSTKAKRHTLKFVDNEKNIHVALNSIETDYYLSSFKLIQIEGEKLRQEYTSEKKIFLYVGGIFKDKRLDILLKSFANIEKKYPHAVLWIVGDGPDRTDIYELSKELKINNIIFWGRIFNDVDKFFSAANFFVLPGIGGLALNQAMLWQCPCIVSEADGTEDDLVIDAITGLRFEKGNSKSLTEAMEKFLLLDRDEFELMTKKCQSVILNDANINTMVKIFKTTFNEISG